MQIVFSTHSGLYVGDLLPSDQISVRRIAVGYYYGIATYEDHFIVAVRTNGMSKESPTVFESYTNDGEPLPAPLIECAHITDVHQITSGPRGLYIANAGRNAFQWIAPDWKETKEIRVGNEDNAENLVNSIFVADSDNLYLMLHNRHTKPSEIMHVIHTDEEWVFAGVYRLPHSGTHNVYKTDNHLYYNASDNSRVVQMHTDSYETEDWDMKGRVLYNHLQFKPAMHIKGMERLPDGRFIIGASENTHTAGRFFSQSFLAVINFDDGAIDAVYELKGPDGAWFGNVNEIRLLQ